MAVIVANIFLLHLKCRHLQNKKLHNWHDLSFYCVRLGAERWMGWDLNLMASFRVRK